ncbi:Putative amino-acid ABC transporter-binding protein YhdW [Seminavis robusta]|uniref:Amino-acid ABC transporter-binding protein YhdW n=1 Tax=Seminavis robusta TaxID=568900 RepID=A0A9N8H5L4_9STRA|nr:Putative amino-acid ABC transporter-binding protein YhdW [Seminavis robusta]|eukprot:Sro26_g017460.1 Putative amino-acid ABC transporter-binding protein YhdW (792) ;mRNA; r:14943-17405
MAEATAADGDMPGMKRKLSDTSDQQDSQLETVTICKGMRTMENDELLLPQRFEGIGQPLPVAYAGGPIPFLPEPDLVGPKPQPMPTPTLQRQRESGIPGAFSVRGICASADDQTTVAPAITGEDESMSEAPPATLFEAVKVEDERAQIEEEIREQVESEIRNRVLEEAVQADVVKTEVPSERKLVRPANLALLLICVLALALGLTLGLSNGDHNVPEESKKTAQGSSEVTDARSTIDMIKERGYVRCGLLPAWAWNDDTKQPVEDEMTVKYCRAMALAALGDSSKIEPVWVTFGTRFILLANNSIDITLTRDTHSMERDINEKGSNVGFSFTTPFSYTGMMFAGIPSFVDCAEALDSFSGHCRDLKICVVVNTTYIDALTKILEGGAIVPSTNDPSGVLAQDSFLEENFLLGKCNVLAGSFNRMSKFLKTYDGEWKVGSKVFSRDPIALTTRDSDPQWSALASLVVNAFLIAESHNITKANAHLMSGLVAEDETSLVTSSLRSGSQSHSKNDTRLGSLLVALVSEFGNHGDLYGSKPRVPRGNGLNRLYSKDQTSGLLYSFPLGGLNVLGPGPAPNSALATVLDRGYLVCGVLPSRGPAFAVGVNSSNGTDWSGFDVGFCQGIAASLFAGDQDNVVYVELVDQTESYFALQNGTVDVVAGARVTLQAQYREQTTGQGFSFSAPFYYDQNGMDAFALMTRMHDVQWSDWVFWIVMATIYAEEEGITSETSFNMPVTRLFGDPLKQMLRDCVSAVGSYAELYNRTVDPYIPRSSANRLNEGLSGAQLFPLPVR